MLPPNDGDKGGNGESSEALAVPFTNMSGDPEQEYFADGIAEELISALSRVRSFFARNSSFTYRGRNVDVRTKWAAPIADQPLPSTSPPRVHNHCAEELANDDLTKPLSDEGQTYH